MTPDPAPAAKLATAFHPLEYIREELQARGWSEDEFARRVAEYEYGIGHLATQLYFAVGEDPQARLGGLARSFAEVFGVSADFFVNLERSWLKAISPAGSPTEQEPPHAD